MHVKKSTGESGFKPIFLRHRWGMRAILALTSPLFCIGGLEIFLRVADVGYPSGFFLPSTINGQKYWIENRQFGWRFFPRGLARKPGVLSVAENRKPGRRRVFVLGGSAAYGDPKPEYGFSRVLDVLLRESTSNNGYEVINAAMTAINSHVVLSIARDCAALSAPGDVWVLYMGNNEVVGPYGPGTVFGMKSPPSLFIKTQIGLKTMRLGQCVDALNQRLRQGSGTLSRWKGLGMFTDNQIRQDDPQMNRVYSHFQGNLEEIITLGTQTGVKVILCTVAVNLKDCAPFASLFRPDLNEAQKTQWSRCVSTGAALEAVEDVQGAADLYRQAAQLDSGHAESLFRLANCKWLLGDTKRAQELFTLARDADVLRFRVDSRINQIIREVGIKHRCLLDTEAILMAQSPHGMLGRDIFYEHVHFNFKGNYRLALAVARDILPSQDHPYDRWLSREACANHLAVSNWSTLDTLERIQNRLKEAPFINQYNHRDQLHQVMEKIERLKTTLSPISLADAIATHRRMLIQTPDDWVLWKNLATLLHKTEDLAGVVHALKQVLDRVPHYAEAWCDIGRCYRQLGRVDLSSEAYRQTLHLWPDCVAALCGLGDIQLEAGEWATARELFEAALDVDPESIEAHVGLGRLHLKRNKPKEAMAYCKKAIDLDLNHTGSRSLLREIMVEGGEYDDVIAYFRERLRQDPNDPVAHFKLGEIFSNLNQPENALQHFRKTVRLVPKLAKAHLCLGMELARMEKDSEALPYFVKALRLQPDNAEAHFSAGVALAREKRFSEAVEYFRTASYLRPGDETIRQYLSASEARLESGTVAPQNNGP